MKGLTPIILILLSIGTFFLIIDPEYKELKGLTKEKDDNNAMLELARQLQKKRDLLRDDFNAISNSEREELLKLLPDTVDNVRLILDINNIAETYGIAIKNIGVSSPEGEGENSNGVGIVRLSFNISSTYDVYLQLLRDLEEALRIVDIRTLTIGGGGGEEQFYNFNVSLETYWLR